MQVFVTGASGWIGSAVVPELVGAGHEVLGLARSEPSAAKLSAAGAKVHRGSLEDLDSLRAGAEAADGVIHLAFIHDFANWSAAMDTDQRAVETLGAALEGSGRPLLIASGTVGLTDGRPGTEQDMPAPGSPRAAAARTVLDLAERKVRSAVVRLPPTVHGRGDTGFVPTLIGIARERGVSAYIGDGSHAWSAVHRIDAARVFRLGLEKAPPGTVLNAVGDVGVPTRTIAGIIGAHLGLPVVSIAPDEAQEHFGWLGMFFGMDRSSVSERTQALLDWHPRHPGLIEDLSEGHYFR